MPGLIDSSSDYFVNGTVLKSVPVAHADDCCNLCSQEKAVRCYVLNASTHHDGENNRMIPALRTRPLRRSVKGCSSCMTRLCAPSFTTLTGCAAQPRAISFRLAEEVATVDTTRIAGTHPIRTAATAPSPSHHIAAHLCARVARGRRSQSGLSHMPCATRTLLHLLRPMTQ